MNRHILLGLLLLFFKPFLDVETQENLTPINLVVLPEKYNLWLIPFFENFTYWGKVTIDFSVLDNIDQLVIVGDSFKLEEIVLIDSETSSMIEIFFGRKTYTDNFVVLTNSSLSGNYSLYITFSGKTNDVRTDEGLFYNSYIVDEVDTFYIATGRSNDEKCNLFPCLNDPVTDVSFTVNIARFDNQFSTSNMPLVFTSTPDNNVEGRVWDTFKETPKILPTSVGITVHELSRNDNLEYSLLTNPEITNQSNFAVAYLPGAADSLQRWLNGVSFPVVKVDVVVLPDYNEEKTHYPGLVFCRENQILYQEGISNANNQEEVVHSAANILTHQLFGLQTYKDRWLLDGITKYLEYKLVSKIEDSWNSDSKFVSDIVQEALLEDNLEMGSSNSHRKVAAVFQMLESFMTEDAIKEAFQTLSKMRGLILLENVLEIFNKTAVAKNNLDLTSVHNFSIFTFLETWISQPGYPIVEVQVNNSTISFKQKDFLQNKLNWPIHVQLSCEDKLYSSSKLWLVGNQTVEFTSDHSTECVLINSYQKGYYRVNYDSNSWQCLIDQLKRNHTELSAGVRSQLIDDAFQLAKLGELDYSVVLALSEYLVHEIDIIPWISASRNFEELIHMFHGTELASDLQAHVVKLFSTFYNSTHRMFSSKDSHVKKTARLHSLHWACRWNLQPCVDFTSALFKQWMSSYVGFPAEYKPSALCSGVKNFPESFFDVVDSLTQSVVDSNRRVHLTALACTSDTTHLLYLLKTAFLSKSHMIYGHNDKLLLFQEIVQNQTNVPIVIEFLVQNYNVMYSRCGESLLRAIWQCLGKACSSLASIQILELHTENALLPLQIREGLNITLDIGKKLHQYSEKLAPLILEAMSLVNASPFLPSPPDVLHSSNALIALKFNWNLFFICITFALALGLVLRK